jgi:hypothetical protein
MEYDENLPPFYAVDNNDVDEFSFNAIRFIDLMRAAENSWTGGHPFDVDPRIIADAIPDAPVKIVGRSWAPPSTDGRKIFSLWCEVPVNSVAYPVPIRVLVYHDDYDQFVFDWVDELPTNNINLKIYISNVEKMEEETWKGLLD